MSAKGYTFEHAGKKVTLPPFKDIPVGVLRKSRKATDEMDRAFTIFEELLSERDLAVLDSLSVTRLGEIVAEWSEGAGVGESSES